MTSHNCLTYTKIKANSVNALPELFVLNPEIKFMLLSLLMDLPRPAMATGISSAWIDRAGLTAPQKSEASHLLELAKTQLLLDPPTLLNALIVIRDKLGGGNTGGNMTQVVQSIARAVGAPGPDEPIDREIEKIAQIL